MDVSRDAATRIAEQILDDQVRPNVAEDVVLTQIDEHPTCWVVGYDTRAYVETGSVIHALAGGGPIIIDRRSGRARIGTSALPADQQLDPE